MRTFLLTCLTLGLAAGQLRSAPPQLLNGIVAIVNDTVITENEAREYIEPAIDFLKRTVPSQSDFQEKALKAYREGLNQLIDRQLMLDDFKTAGYAMPERVIEDFVQERIREQYGNRANLIKTLKARGMTYTDFRAEIRKQFIVEQMQNHHVSSAVLISPFKIETYYQEHQDDYKLPDQIRLRMIVLNKVAGADNSAVDKLASEILTKIGGGADFKEMATIYSEGSQRAQAGDWGWIEKSVLRKELALVALGLKKGQTSGVIDTPDASYIMRLEDSRISHMRPLEEVRDEIEKTLISEERKRLQKKYIDRLREKAFIRFF